MKTNKLFALAAITALALVACKKETPAPAPDPTPEVKVNATTLNVAAAGESKEFSVTANVSWTATKDAEWVTVSPASAQISDFKSTVTTVTVTAAENTGAARTATVTIKADGVKDVTVTVSQAEVPVPDPVFALLDGDLNPVTGDITATSASGSTGLFVNANVSWTATSDAEWLTVTPESAEIKDYVETPTAVTLTWGANFSDERSATVTFQVDGVEPVALKVSQSAFLQGDFCDIHIRPGQYSQDPESNATNTIALVASGTNVQSIKYLLVESSVVEGIAVEKLYAAVTAEGEEFKSEWISYVNNGGLNLSLTGCTPETSYTLIAYATNADNEVQYFISESSTLGDYIFQDYTKAYDYHAITSKESLYGEYLLLAKTSERLPEFTGREIQGSVMFSDGGTSTDEEGYSYDWVDVSGMWNTQFNSKYGLGNDVMKFDLSDGFLFMRDSEDLGNLVEKASGTPVVTSFCTLTAFEGSNSLFGLYAPIAGAVIDETGTIAFFDTEYYMAQTDSEGKVLGSYLATLLYSTDSTQGGWYAAYRDIMFVPQAKATPATISAAKENASRIQKEIHKMPMNYVERYDTRVERAIRKVRSERNNMSIAAVRL